MFAFLNKQLRNYNYVLTTNLFKWSYDPRVMNSILAIA